MKDRYLFRAKRTDNGEWVEGNLVELGKESFSNEIRFGITEKAIPILGKTVFNLRIDEVDPSTICQCTGLKDKNGNPIFENDIVKYHFGEKYAKIKYGVYQSCFDSTKTGHCGFYVDWPDSENKRKDLGYWIDMVDAEIVGNIFDNPELLEAGE